MNTRFAKNGFAAVRDFISPELANIAHKYAMLRSKLGLGKKLEGKKARCGERQQYGDHLMETILDQSTSKMEMIVGRELWPSYSFYRLYTKGMFFPRHRDRPSCEFSVSLCLGRDFSNLSPGDAKADWPLFANGVPVPCPPGGGVVYKGCEVEHSRAFERESSAATFSALCRQKWTIWKALPFRQSANARNTFQLALIQKN